ncbi:MAG: hypothetical protein IKS55_15040 [Oscillospiraceae bacterium]|nr:hypothetical protein [Oscillospiraceae bacterium]
MKRETLMAYYYCYGNRTPRVSVPEGSAPEAELNPMKWVKTGYILLAVATLVAILLNFLTLYLAKKAAEPAVEEAPSKVTYIQARPPSTPAPTPTISSLRLYAGGGELTADGFTTYVEDRPIEITVVTEPKITRPPVYWSLSDEKAASLTISDDRTSCKFTALKPVGKTELTVSCYGAEMTIPVYLWER